MYAATRMLFSGAEGQVRRCSSGLTPRAAVRAAGYHGAGLPLLSVVQPEGAHIWLLGILRA